MAQPRKLNIKGKYLLIGLILLVLIIGAAAWYNLSQRGEAADGYSLTIAKDGKPLKTYTLQEIEKMPSVEIYAELQSAQKGDEKGTFKGVDLRQLLDQTDKNLLKDCKQFICVAGDGYSSALSSKDLSKKENAILAYEKDGTPFTHFNEGGSGPMRVIIAADTYGNRSTKFLIRIECRE